MTVAEGGPALPDTGAILNTLPSPVVVVDGDDVIRFANGAAESFFSASASQLLGRCLDHMVSADSPLFPLVHQARRQGGNIVEYGVALEGPRIGAHEVTIQVGPMGDDPDSVALVLHERSIAEKIDRQLVSRNAARSVTAMAAMLAHEVKNPMSGIRGAAQLLEQKADAPDRELTQLICDETDRICGLIDRIGAFAEDAPVARAAVNIHQVLERARKVAENGFARGIRIAEEYDPSLPPVYGDRDQLIQVFLNLIKNAAEAAPARGGEIVLSTAYEHSLRLSWSNARDGRVHLPLVVTVQDNGPGIAEELQSHLFDPFVTTKPNGTGLGLALVAKVVGDHGGVIEFDSEPRRTRFHVRLPFYVEPDGS